MTTKTALSPRPSPPNEQISSKVLHPIYQSLDSHNYSKALKLTSSSSPSSDWDIVKALRIHALERTGKKREALLLLWEVLTKGVVLSANVVGISGHGSDHGSKQAEEVWWELYERIQSLTDAADLVVDAAASASCWNAPLLDPVERLDVRGFACLARKGISSSGGGAGSGNAITAAASAGATSKTSSKGKPSKGGKQHSSSSNGGDSNSRAKCYPPVTDDAVLSTLAVTLRIEGLYATLSEMYFQAIEEAISPSTGEMSADNLQSVLEEAVCVHFRAVCDCSSVENKSNSNHYHNHIHNHNHNDSTSSNGNDNGNGNDNDNANSETSNRSVLSDEQLRCKLPNLKTLLQLTTYYERMQTSSLQLSKLSGESLHFQWTAIASLWYKESLVELVELLETLSSTLALQGNTDQTDDKQSKLPSNRRHTIQQHVCSMLKIESPSEIQPMMQKLKQKIALLPRLAESLSSRMVKNKQLRQEQRQSSQAVDDAGYGPSESDWDVYLETLLHQNKKEEALEVLKSIPCSSMTSVSGDGGSASDDPHDSGSGSGTGILPQIHDEHTIENHVGSVLPYTQRKKLERLSAIALELGKFEEASGWYRELLGAFPDQWTYWVGLVDSSVLLGTRQWLRCKEKNSVMNGEGWNSCRSFAKEVIASLEERKGARSIRGPYLVLIELAAVKVLAESGRGVEALREEICSYGDRFGPLASCCFADIRCYISILVQSTIGADGSNDISDEVSKLLVWAKNIWMENSQTDTDAGNGPVSAEDLRERRKKLRAYIFAVQVVYCVTAELGVGCMTLQLYSPSIPQMTSEWHTSLSFLPGVAPKDGGQKEILPGDEIILLITQYLLFQISCESPRKPKSHKLIAAAALLEQAMVHSPYNPHLKIAAIGVYSQLHAAYRALSIYNELGVKQIQLDSCSYLILPLLMRGGLYTSAIEISSSILRLHGSTSKDVKDYASKSFQNGYLLKAKEMVTFQREKMRPSLQLLYSKGVVMDCAALMKASDLNGGLTSNEPKNHVPAVKLGEVRGLSGGDGDLAKAEKLTTDAEGHFNAPSIIHAAASNATLQDFVFSDNRDMTVNYFEILFENRRLTENEMTSESLMRGHIHGILVRAVMLSGVAKGPKKGKVPKCSDEMTYRCLSLVDAIERLNRFSMGHGVQMHDMEKQLLQLLCALCQTVAMIVTGTENDSMAEREKTVVSIIESVQPIVASVRDAFKSYADNTINDRSGAMVCQLLPDRIVPVYILIETTATLFDLFGWGKRKRKTKPAAGALAELALSFRDLLSDMMHATSLFRAFGDGSNTTDAESLIKRALDSICDKQREDAASNREDYAAVRRAINEVSVSRSMTTDRVDPFLVDMWENLGSFENNE